MDEDRLIKKLTAVFDQRFEKIDQRFEEVNQKFDEVNERLDILTAESHETNQLARGIHDEMIGRYEKNKAEIDEVKKHLKIPLTPPFGD